jgi:hypothetical protein
VGRAHAGRYFCGFLITYCVRQLLNTIERRNSDLRSQVRWRAVFWYGTGNREVYSKISENYWSMSHRARGPGMKRECHSWDRWCTATRRTGHVRTERAERSSPSLPQIYIVLESEKENILWWSWRNVWHGRSKWFTRKMKASSLRRNDDGISNKWLIYY